MGRYGTKFAQAGPARCLARMSPHIQARSKKTDVPRLSYMAEGRINAGKKNRFRVAAQKAPQLIQAESSSEGGRRSRQEARRGGTGGVWQRPASNPGIVERRPA